MAGAAGAGSSGCATRSTGTSSRRCPASERPSRPSLSVYHCVDDFSGVPHWWNMSASVRAREAAACREADVVICTGRMLVEERRRFNPNIHFVPEGADVELFSTALDEATPVPEDIARLRGKIVGYVGVVDFRLDTALLAYMAEQQPDWSFAIVGPVKGDVQGLERLQALRNVHFFGNRPITALPAYLKAMDAGLIPYVLNDFTHHIFPLKLYEYMAAGKPIVATDMEEMRAYDGHGLTIARSNESFLEAVRSAIANDSPELAAGRSRAAASESWDHRVEQVSSILEPMLRQRDQRSSLVDPRRTPRTDEALMAARFAPGEPLSRACVAPASTKRRLAGRAHGRSRRSAHPGSAHGRGARVVAGRRIRDYRAGRYAGRGAGAGACTVDDRRDDDGAVAVSDRQLECECQRAA